MSWEIGLGTLAGLGLGLMGSFWFSRIHIHGGALTANFYDVCSSVAAIRDGTLESYSLDRSYLVGWLPSFLSNRWGITDGLGMSATLSLCVLGSGLYLWARALHSRFAGLLALAFVPCVGPVVALGRTLNFYPQFVAVFVLNAGACCLALRSRSWKALLFGSCTLALTLLVDARGLIWAATGFPILVLALLRAPPERWPSRGLVLLVPLLLSWLAAQVLYNPESTGLVRQANPIRNYYENGPSTDDAPPMPHNSELPHFLWGHTPIQDMPSTLLYLASTTHRVAALMQDVEADEAERALHMKPFIPLAWAGGLFTLFGLRRHRIRLAALGLTALPFAAVIYHTMKLEYLPRFAASGLPLLTLLLGVGVASLWTGSPPKSPGEMEPARREPPDSRLACPPLQPCLQFGFLALLTTGVMPSFLSPHAAWRTNLWDDSELHQLVRSAKTLNSGEGMESPGAEKPLRRQGDACISGLGKDISNGLDPHGRIYFISTGGPVGVMAPEIR